MTIEIVPFDDARLQDFVYDGIETEYTKDIDINEIAIQYATLGDSYMAIIDEKTIRVIAIGGIYSIWQNVGQAWLFVNKEARNYKGEIFRKIKTYLDRIMEAKDYKKVQIMCVKDSFEANNLAEHLNFTKVCDMILYAKLF